MKKILMIMVALLVGVAIHAQGFSYLRFNTGAGSEQCVSTDGLKITWELVGDAVTDADYRIYRKDIEAADFDVLE